MGREDIRSKRNDQQTQKESGSSNRSAALWMDLANLSVAAEQVQRRPFHGTNLAFPYSSMQKHLSVKTQRAGVVHINCQTGHLFWEEENLDPVVWQYAKKYLVQEGFLEQALGTLDPQPNYDADPLLDEILN